MVIKRFHNISVVTRLDEFKSGQQLHFVLFLNAFKNKIKNPFFSPAAFLYKMAGFN